jgi:class 3 adenylate cyclase
MRSTTDPLASTEPGRAAEDTRKPVVLHRATLRFEDPELEESYQRDFFRHNVANLRFAFLGGIALWIVFGFVIDGYLLVQADQTIDLVMRYGVFVPLLLVGLGLSFVKGFDRVWEWVAGGIVIVTIVLWVYYNTQVLTMPVDYGYVGLILITAFTYTLLRLRFVLVVVTTAVAIATYVPYAVLAVHIFGVKTLLATMYLTTFGGLWGVAAYRLERFTRLLFLRERQLDRERERSDSLLLNVLPRVIIDRLKRESDGGHVAEALDDVSVMFADAVGSTEQAARGTPEEFATALDELFRRFDAIADRYGLEKIKTIGDAYMAAGGAPVPMANHAEAVADAALDMLAEAAECRWPSGDPIVLRVGTATGPAVAGVIGQRKFAYDLWGDTVNLASRLEANGEPSRILVSESMAERLEDRFEFSPPQVIDIKGKGLTPVRFLIGRLSEIPASTARS